MSGRYSLELGPNGAVTYSEWTCPWCDRTLENVHATTRPAFHRLNCPEQPHPDQVGLEVWAGGPA